MGEMRLLLRTSFIGSKEKEVTGKDILDVFLYLSYDVFDSAATEGCLHIGQGCAASGNGSLEQFCCSFISDVTLV